MNPVTWPWLAEIALITYRSMTGQRFQLTRGTTNLSLKAAPIQGPNVKTPPLPSEFLATFIIFGLYSILGESSNPSTQRIGGLLGWGTVLATFLILAQGGTPAANQSGTFPPTVNAFPNQPLPTGVNYPPQGGK